MPRENTIQSTHASKGTNFTYAYLILWHQQWSSSSRHQFSNDHAHKPPVQASYGICCDVVLQDVRHQCVYRACYAHSCRCHCRCQWVWLWSSQVARSPMGRRCQVGMPRQLRLVQRTATDSPMLAQPRHPLSLPGMGLMTLRHMSDLRCWSSGAT